MEKSLSIIKPDGVSKGVIGEVIRRFEKEKLKIIALKMVKLSKKEAQEFYYVHKDKEFFESLTDFMSSGPIVVMVLEGDDAINRIRKIMGETDPKRAELGSIRREYADNIERNIVHGSDSKESAEFEIGYFFNRLEIVK
jgi:nucleoside-diphosphate kinase